MSSAIRSGVYHRGPGPAAPLQSAPMSPGSAAAARPSPGGVPGLLGRLASALLTLISRDVAVVTNAIAFNFLLCLFPLLLVLVTLTQQTGGSRRAGPALVALMNEIIP